MATTTNLNSLVINYLTQAQYEAAAQAGTLNENQLYLTPAAQKITTTALLSSNNWSNKTQSIVVSDITNDSTIFVAAAPSSIDDYIHGEIRCISQATNSLTFTCKTVPDNDITVNIVILS